MGRVFCSKTPGNILARFKCGYRWLRHPHSGLCCSYPAHFPQQGVGAGHCPEKDLGTCPAPRFLNAISHGPSTPSTCLGQLQEASGTGDSSCKLQTPLAWRSSPFLISVLSVLAASVSWGNQELPLAYLQISTALFKMLKTIFFKEGREKKTM